MSESEIVETTADEPTEPTEPADAGEPSAATESAEAGEADEASEPTAQSEADEPSESTALTEVTETSEPTAQSEADEPSEPTAQSEADEPSESTALTEVTETSEPTAQSEADEPSESTALTEVTETSEPTAQSEADEPSESTALTEVTETSEATAQSEADEPSEPTGPNEQPPLTEPDEQPPLTEPDEQPPLTEPDEQLPLTEASEPTALTAPAEAPVARKRRFPWRWLGAVVTALAVGTGCAFAVMAPQRTNLPGLKTAPDGRYVFAPLTLPTLAPGQAAPSSTADPGQQHLSDIRKLLLSPPQGATPDRSLPGTSGWISLASTLKLLNDPQAAEQFQTDGWRHTAGIAWKTPDGAETKIWLLQFIDADAAGDAYEALNSFDGESLGVNAATINVGALTSVSYNHVVKGATATWFGVTQVHDADFLIVYTAPASIGLAPFEQEVDLQAELLQ